MPCAIGCGRSSLRHQRGEMRHGKIVREGLAHHADRSSSPEELQIGSTTLAAEICFRPGSIYSRAGSIEVRVVLAARLSRWRSAAVTKAASSIRTQDAPSTWGTSGCSPRISARSVSARSSVRDDEEEDHTSIKSRRSLYSPLWQADGKRDPPRGADGIHRSLSARLVRLRHRRRSASTDGRRHGARQRSRNPRRLHRPLGGSHRHIAQRLCR